MRTEQWVAAVVIPAVVPLVMKGLSLAVVRTKPGELRYARVFRWFALMITLLPTLGVLALALVKPPVRPEDRLPFVMLVLLFPALGGPLMIEFFRVRHRYDGAGVTVRSPWSRRRHLAWADVASLRWRKLAKWFDLRTRDGAVLHVAPWLSGAQGFADAALARIPPGVLAAHPEGRAVLQLMSAGQASALMTEAASPEQLLAAITPGQDRRA